MTADLVEATMGPVRQALSDSGLKASDLNKILLVGGSSRIPAVQEAIKNFTGVEPFKGINPMNALQSARLFRAAFLGGDVEGILLLDVTPLSLGIETMGGVSTKIIERNTTIPTKKSQISRLLPTIRPLLRFTCFRVKENLLRIIRPSAYSISTALCPLPAACLRSRLHLISTQTV